MFVQSANAEDFDQPRRSVAHDGCIGPADQPIAHRVEARVRGSRPVAWCTGMRMAPEPQGLPAAPVGVPQVPSCWWASHSRKLCKSLAADAMTKPITAASSR